MSKRKLPPRAIMVGVRMTTKEHKELERKAYKAGLSGPAYIRMLVKQDG